MCIYFGHVGTGASWISGSDKLRNNAIAVARECRNCAAKNGAELCTKLANEKWSCLDTCCMHVVVGERGLLAEQLALQCDGSSMPAACPGH